MQGLHSLRCRGKFCTCTCSLFGFYRGLLRGCCNLGLHQFRLHLLCSGSLLGHLGCLSDWFRGGFGDGGGSAGPDYTPTEDNVAPSLAQVHLLGRGPGPLSFRGRRLARGGCSTTQGRSLFSKGCRSLFPFHTAPVVRCVVAPANAAQRLRRAGRAVT